MRRYYKLRGLSAEETELMLSDHLNRTRWFNANGRRHLPEWERPWAKPSLETRLYFHNWEMDREEAKKWAKRDRRDLGWWA